jgi:hypothetical protein
LDKGTRSEYISLLLVQRVLVQNVEALFERGFFGEMGTKGRVGHCDNIYVLTLGQAQARILFVTSPKKNETLTSKREIIP